MEGDAAFDKNRNKKAILLFLILTYVVTKLLQLFINLFYGGALREWFGSFGDFLYENFGYIVMYCPAVACLIVSRRYPAEARPLGLRLCQAKYLAAGVLYPVLYLLASFGIFWLSHPGSLLPFHFSGALLMQIPVHIIFAFGEEIGWRGFLSPAMTARFGFIKGYVYVGIIWGAWHYTFNWLIGRGYTLRLLQPLYFFGFCVGFLMFVLSTVFNSLMMSYLRIASGSVWPCVLLHASHNYVLVALLDPITDSVEKQGLLGETGLITFAAMGILAVMAYDRYGEKCGAEILGMGAGV